jgi:hypothetical protein
MLIQGLSVGVAVTPVAPKTTADKGPPVKLEPKPKAVRVI